MKKFMWIATIIVAFVVVFIGCPTGGGDLPPTGGGGFEFWLASSEYDDALKIGNRVKLTGTAENADDPVVYIMFTPMGLKFNEIEIDFEFADGDGFNMSWQCVYDENGTWGQSGNDYIGWLEEGPISVDPVVMFTSAWGHNTPALSKETMKGICLRITIPVGVETEFILKDVKLAGLEAAPVLQRIEVTSPNRRGYFVGDAFEIAGFKAEAIYDKERFNKDVTGSVTLSTANITNLTNGFVFTEAHVGENIEVTVRFSEGGFIEEDYFIINVQSLAGNVSSVTITTPPTKLIYYADEEFSTSGLAVSAVINDSPSDVSTLVTLSTDGIVNLINGFQFTNTHIGTDIIVTVKYLVHEADNTFNITIRARPLITDIIDTSKLTDFGNIFLADNETTYLVYRTMDTSQPAIHVIPNPAVSGSNQNEYRLTLNFVPPVDLSEFKTFDYTMSQEAEHNFRIYLEQGGSKDDFSGITSTSRNLGAELAGTTGFVSSIEIWVAPGSFTEGELFVTEISFAGVYIPPVIGGEWQASGIRIVNTEGASGGSSSLTVGPLFAQGSNVDKTDEWGVFRKVWVYFDPLGHDFDTISVNLSYTNNGGNVAWISAYDNDGEKSFNGNTYIGWFGWGSSTGTGSTNRSNFINDSITVNGNTINCIALEIHVSEGSTGVFSVSGITFTKHAD